MPTCDPKVPFLLAINSLCLIGSSSSFFQCRRLSDTQVFTPNINGRFFQRDHLSTSFNNGDVETLVRNRTYIYPSKPVEVQPNCTGPVVAINYCYLAQGTENRVEFTLLAVTGENGTIDTSPIKVVESNQSPGRCSYDSSNNSICCDVLNEVRAAFGNASHLRFGIRTSQTGRLLSLKNHTVEQLVFGTSSDNYSNRSRTGGVPLIRYTIGKFVVLFANVLYMVLYWYSHTTCPFEIFGEVLLAVLQIHGCIMAFEMHIM